MDKLCNAALPLSDAMETSNSRLLPRCRGDLRHARGDPGQVSLPYGIVGIKAGHAFNDRLRAPERIERLLILPALSQRGGDPAVGNGDVALHGGIVGIDLGGLLDGG